MEMRPCNRIGGKLFFFALFRSSSTTTGTTTYRREKFKTHFEKAFDSPPFDSFCVYLRPRFEIHVCAYVRMCLIRVHLLFALFIIYSHKGNSLCKLRWRHDDMDGSDKREEKVEKKKDEKKTKMARKERNEKSKYMARNKIYNTHTAWAIRHQTMSQSNLSNPKKRHTFTAYLRR